MILQVLIAMVAGWVQRHQQQVIAYLMRRIASSQPNSAATGYSSLIRNAAALPRWPIPSVANASKR
jgi:hypothetical protein